MFSKKEFLKKTIYEGKLLSSFPTDSSIWKDHSFSPSNACKHKPFAIEEFMPKLYKIGELYCRVADVSSQLEYTKKMANNGNPYLEQEEKDYRISIANGLDQNFNSLIEQINELSYHLYTECIRSRNVMQTYWERFEHIAGIKGKDFYMTQSEITLHITMLKDFGNSFEVFFQKAQEINGLGDYEGCIP